MNRFSEVLLHELPRETLALEELRDCDGELVIRLSAREGRHFSVKFDDYIAYRKGDEGDMLVPLSQIQDSSRLGGTLYEVTDSDYIAWFMQQSRGTRARSDVRHFTLLSIDDVIDVIALSAPSVSCSDPPSGVSE